jgi:GT2 family glycosyltransferase
VKVPALGVAIVHYRADDLLRRCLDRLRRSTLQDFAVCVVDNGSDEGLTWLDGLDPRIDVVRPSANLGFAAGVNLAVRRLPASPFLLLLNPDVLVEEHTLAAVRETLEGHPGLGAATCRLVLPDGAIDPACRRAEPTLFSAFAKQFGLAALFPRSARLGRYNLRALDPERPHAIDSGSGAFLMLRRRAFAAAGGLDERYFLYGEDLDLCRTVRGAGWAVAYTPSAQALHVKGSGRVRAASATLHFHRAMWTYYRKWGDRGRNVVVLAALAVAISTLAVTEIVRNAFRRGRVWTPPPEPSFSEVHVLAGDRP